MSRITGRLAAVFRRSHGDNRPAAPAIAARRSAPVPLPSTVPRPPRLVVADGYVVAGGTRFAPVARSAEFFAAVPAQQRIALRLPTTEYGNVMGELMRWFDASEYDEASPAYRAYRYAALACAGCGWEFPGSYTGSLLGMFAGARVVGGTTGFAEFGRTGQCPRCGSMDSFLLYELIDAAEIDEADLAALARLWRDDALRWWSRTGRERAICDSCNRDMLAGEGYFLSSAHLECERCGRDRLHGGLEKLRANPYCYGSTELRRARPFRPGPALAEGGALGASAAKPAPARQEWAREMIFRHVARAELELRPDLTDRHTWRRLLNPEVLDFVLDIDPDAAAAVSGAAHPFRVRTFGDLSVFVNLFDVAQADRIRDLMAGGWESYLDKLLHATGIRLGERDVAHWILGREPGDGGAIVHLAYLPAAADSDPLVPIDLLAPMGPDTPR